MINFYFIRHAECAMNLDVDLYVGGRSNESPLTERGVLQSRLLGRSLTQKGVRFDSVYSSPAVRTRDTAKLSCLEMGFALDRIIQRAEFLELSQGTWEGMVRKEVYTPEMLAEINSNNWHFKAPGGESQKEVEERMLRMIENITRDNGGEDRSIGIFGHGVAIKCALRGLFHFSPTITYKIPLDNTSLTKVEYSGDRWYLRGINDTTHLL